MINDIIFIPSKQLNTKLKHIMHNNDFIKAIGNNKKNECFRLFVELPEDKIGVTAWYTMGIFEDVKQEFTGNGKYKILKIEKEIR